MSLLAADVDAHGGRSVLLLAIVLSVEDLLHRAPLHGRQGLIGRSRVPLVEGPPLAGCDIVDRLDHLRGRVVERPLRLGPRKDQDALLPPPPDLLWKATSSARTKTLRSAILPLRTARARR